MSEGWRKTIVLIESLAFAGLAAVLIRANADKNSMASMLTWVGIVLGVFLPALTLTVGWLYRADIRRALEGHQREDSPPAARSTMASGRDPIPALIAGFTGIVTACLGLFGSRYDDLPVGVVAVITALIVAGTYVMTARSRRNDRS